MEFNASISPPNTEAASSRRPPNSYMLYCLENRERLRSQHPELPNVDISRMLGEEWKKLDESAKRAYKDRAKTLQQQFKQNNPDYKYEKARKKRKERDFLIQQTRKPAGFDFQQLISGIAGNSAVFASQTPNPPVEAKPRQQAPSFESGGYFSTVDLFERHAQ